MKGIGSALAPSGLSGVAFLAGQLAHLPAWPTVSIIVSGPLISLTIAYLRYKQATHHDDIAEKIAHTALTHAPDNAAAVLAAFTGHSDNSS